MQNSYTKEGQLSWWLAFLECLWIHKGKGFEPLPFKTQKYFNFYPKPVQPAQLEGPQAGPRALDLPRARPSRPIDQSTGSVARPGLGHGPYSSGPAGPARLVGDPCLTLGHSHFKEHFYHRCCSST